jgi:leader peptidase (prepilin peptidase)/N-methyltransferase
VTEPAAALRAVIVGWAALAGACVGSFLNVVVARVPAGESVVRPRSRCPRCEASIAWYDNVPVVSWLMLRGRCRRCGVRIPIRYPALELAGGAAAVVAVLRHGFTLGALAEFAFVALLLALSAIDLDTWLLPHVLTWPTIALGVAASALGAAAAPSLSSSLAGAGVGFALFGTIAVVGEKVLEKEAMGWGDVWLLAGLGAFLGLGAILPVVLLASLQGAVVGLLLIVLGKAQRGPPQVETPTPSTTAARTSAPLSDDDWVPPRNAVPFGPFLALAGVEWLWASDCLARVAPALELFR